MEKFARVNPMSSRERPLLPSWRIPSDDPSLTGGAGGPTPGPSRSQNQSLPACRRAGAPAIRSTRFHPALNDKLFVTLDPPQELTLLRSVKTAQLPKPCKGKLMKKRLVTTLAACSLLALPLIATEDTGSTSAAIDFGTFTPPEEGTFVEIKVNRSLINMAARLAKDSEPEMARILEGLRSLRINVMEFDQPDGRNVKSRIQSIRKELEAHEWEQVVCVKEEKEDVGIYVKLNGEDSVEGVAVTVIEEHQAVLIHVDGSIRPEELARLGERLNLEPLKQLEVALDNPLNED